MDYYNWLKLIFFLLRGHPNQNVFFTCELVQNNNNQDLKKYKR